MPEIKGIKFTEAEMLYLDYQKNKAGSFSTHLFNAIGAADRINKERLRTVFPDEVKAQEAWCDTGELYRRATEAGLIKLEGPKK